jgi:hypothetical protein
MSETLIGTTNELLLSYDKKFNENYSKIVKFDGAIQNKEQLIIQYNEVIMGKEKNIIILQYLIFLFLIFCILTILYNRKIINFTIFIGMSVFMIFIFALIIYFAVLNHYNASNIEKKIQGLQVAMQSYAQKLLQDTVPGYTCPVKCDKKKNEEEEINIDMLQQEPGDTLNINPQLNVWKLGSIPYNTKGIRDPMLYDKGDEPKPSFGTTYPKSTYYQCDWLGGEGKTGPEGLPLGGPTPDKPFSTIPCSFKPNMKQKAKYICDSDPNGFKDTTSLEFKEKCILVLE